MLIPHTRLHFIDESVGYGVFATQRIPAGTVTWIRDPLDREWDEQVTLGESWQRLFEKYSYITARGTRLMCWDFTRFMNHSCRATSFLVGDSFEVAVRDIEVDEQLTNDYATLNLEEDFDCLCGDPMCRGTVSKLDLDSHAEAWDLAIRHALAMGARIEQPLAPWCPGWKSIVRLMDHPERARPIRSSRWMPAPTPEALHS